MASTTLQCRGRGGGCLGGTAITSKGITPSRATAVAGANLRGTRSYKFEKAFLHGAGKRAVASGEPVAVLRSLSKSAAFGGSTSSPWYRGSHVFRSKPHRALLVQHGMVVQMIEKVPTNVEMLEAYEIEEKVRDYELDHYGVVNNAIYVQFVHHVQQA